MRQMVHIYNGAIAQCTSTQSTMSELLLVFSNNMGRKDESTKIVRTQKPFLLYICQEDCVNKHVPRMSFQLFVFYQCKANKYDFTFDIEVCVKRYFERCLSQILRSALGEWNMYLYNCIWFGFGLFYRFAAALLELRGAMLKTMVMKFGNHR